MLGVVILNYKNFLDTINCVKSFYNCGYKSKYKIYIVDNASPNQSVSELQKAFSQDEKVELIVSNENGGYSAGNNIGLRMAVKDGCKAILLTNSDVEFKSDSVSIMEKALFEDEKCGVVGPKVFDGDGIIQNRNKGILTSEIFVLKRKGFEKFDFKKKVKEYGYYNYDYSYPLKPSGMLSGCCFIIKASVLEEIDYLDEGVFLYHEEDILGARLRKAGYYPLLNPKAEVIHLEGRSTGKLNAFLRYNTLYSGLYYLWKYSDTKLSSFNFCVFVAKLMLFFKAITNKEYRKYLKQLKQKIKELKKTER